MDLRVVHATKNCKESTCPTIYQDEQGRYVIQGFIIKDEDKTGINLPNGEDAVVVPKEFMEAFLAKQ